MRKTKDKIAVEVDVEKIRMLKARGLLSSQIAEVVKITQEEVVTILDKIYSKNPFMECLDELEVIKQQYNEIFYSPTSNGMIKIEVLKQMLTLSMTKLAITLQIRQRKLSIGKEQQIIEEKKEIIQLSMKC